jgi:hypothetical protein
VDSKALGWDYSGLDGAHPLETVVKIDVVL